MTISARRADRLAEAARTFDGGVHCVAADVADEDQVVNLVREHTEHFGRLDVLVNSAGIGGAESSATADTAQVHLQVAVNLRGPLLVTREALPLLLAAGAEHGKALIVNLSSVSGKMVCPGWRVTRP